MTEKVKGKVTEKITVKSDWENNRKSYWEKTGKVTEKITRKWKAFQTFDWDLPEFQRFNGKIMIRFVRVENTV